MDLDLKKKGEQLRKFRKDNDIHPRDMAKKLYTSFGTLNNFELGKRKLPDHSVGFLFDVYGFTFEPN